MPRIWGLKADGKRKTIDYQCKPVDDKGIEKDVLVRLASATDSNSSGPIDDISRKVPMTKLG